MGTVCFERREEDSIEINEFVFRVSYVEEQAIQNLTEKLTANKNRLMKEFAFVDPQNTGETLMECMANVVVVFLVFRSNFCE